MSIIHPSQLASRNLSPEQIDKINQALAACQHTQELLLDLLPRLHPASEQIRAGTMTAVGQLQRTVVIAIIEAGS